MRHCNAIWHRKWLGRVRSEGEEAFKTKRTPKWKQAAITIVTLIILSSPRDDCIIFSRHETHEITSFSEWKTQLNQRKKSLRRTNKKHKKCLQTRMEKQKTRHWNVFFNLFIMYTRNLNIINYLYFCFLYNYNFIQSLKIWEHK